MVKHIRLDNGDVYFVEDRRDLRKALRKLEKSGYRWRAGQGLGCTRMRKSLRFLLATLKYSEYSLYLGVSKSTTGDKAVISYGTDMIERCSIEQRCL